ncbi:MAG: hypothetical protein GY805_15965 [Chloroflexi bacterium]|nr:hypothetical protein [Chloroflexota bacterium]
MMKNNKWFRSAKLPLLTLLAILTAVFLSTVSLIQPANAQETVSAPVEQATFQGQVINGTTNEAFGDGEVRLRAFTINLEEMYSETVPINEDGSFEFIVEDVSPDWVFLADVAYSGLTFNSNAVQVSNAEPSAQMPIVVFDSTTDPAAVAIDRLHMILAFSEGQLLVSELYVFSNVETAVFIGESGNADEGTVEIGLPTGAENVTFQRGFGTSMDSFIPATEFIQTDRGWADTVPLRAGSNSLNLLVSYDLSYDDGLLLAHPLAYPATSASTIIAEVGVTITGEGWEFQGAQSTATGSYLGYINNSIVQADVLSLTLNGRPTQIVDTQGNPLPVRNRTNELIIGGVVLAMMLGVGLFFVQRWRAEPSPAHAATNVSIPAQKAKHQDGELEKLLQSIADLDDVYEAGELDEADYRQQRQDLKSQLTAVWK